MLWASLALGVAWWVRRREFLKVRWRPAEETWVALGLGLLAILLSVAMLPLGREAMARPAGFLLRDFLMVLVCGWVMPTWYVFLRNKGAWRDLGLSGENILASLGVGAATGFFICLGLVFGEPKPVLDAMLVKSLLALLAPGVFEAVLYYGFLRTALTKAFGRLPAIALGATLYALHHIGFELPFAANPAGKLAQLLLVGVMMQSVTAITDNGLTYFPLAYLPGVTTDILLDPAVVRRIAGSVPRGLAVLGLMAAWLGGLAVVRRRLPGAPGQFSAR